MRSLDLRIDVTNVLGSKVPLHIAATVHLPEAHGPAPTAVMFAFPGAGYSRGYFDLHFRDREGYSQAAHHTACGIVLVACDHLGVGDSTAEGEHAFSLDMIAQANAHAVSEIMRQCSQE